MHKPPLPPIIYASLFPSPKATDPPNFQTHISKQLVPEVRAETARFYGHINCVEAQYPGLDYATLAHRLRLSRFPHHRRLFQVFDHLRLTNHEIQTLCKWEGTRWARERYEKDIGRRVLDTTWDDVVLAIPEPPTVTRTQLRGGNRPPHATQCAYLRRFDPSSMDAAVQNLTQEVPEERMPQSNDRAEEEEEEEGSEGSEEKEADVDQEAEESEDELQQSVGVELNQRLMAAMEARNRGEEAVLDPDWEQWLKEAAERGAVPDVTVANTSQGFSGHSNAWAPQVSGAFPTDPAGHPFSAPISMASPVNPSLDGSPAPPTGTAM